MPKHPKETVAITTPHVSGDEDIGEIRNIVGFHIRLAHGAVYRHFTETFADLDLTQKQVSALWLIDDHPDIAQTGLAQRMRMIAPRPWRSSTASSRRATWCASRPAVTGASRP